MNLEDRVRILENDMMLVKDGSLVEHISEAIHWKATTKTLTGGTDYTVDGTWTDLDLQLWTSVKAKYVFLMLVHNDTCAEADLLGVRENGKTPSQYPFVKAPIAAKKVGGFVFVKVDADQVIEYYATDASDTVIEILGYIE